MDIIENEDILIEEEAEPVTEDENDGLKKKKSLSANSFFYLIYTILNVFFPLATGIYVTRVLFPDTIGSVETARNLVQYFSILAFLGIPTYGLREIAKIRKDKSKLNKLVTELFIINTISTTVFTLIYIALIFSVPVYRNNLSLYLITGIAIILNFFNISWLYEGLEEFKFISIRNILFKALAFILLVILVKSESDYLTYALITVIGTSGNFILDIMFAPKKVKFTRHELNLKQHMKPIMFLVVVNLAIEIYSLIDITMLSFMTDSETVAFYSYGAKINKLLLQVVNTFTIVIIPRIAFYYKEGRKEEYNNLLTNTLLIIVIITIPMIVGIWFVSDYMLTALYGDAYIRSSYVLKILCFILLVSPIGYLLGSRVMLTTENENKMFIPVTIGAVANIILNAILISFYDEKGAAIASLVSEFIILVVYLYISHKHFKDIIDFLVPGDVLVVNNTRVLPARIIAHKPDRKSVV